MLYRIAHFFRDNLSFLWEILEWLNSLFFSFLYGSRLKKIDSVLMVNSKSALTIRKASVKDAPTLALFFADQPEASFAFFKPHRFDEKSLKSLLKRTSFLMFLVEEQNCIVGYFFLRTFCHGQAYLGKMVDHKHQGKGIGKMMCMTAMDVAMALGVRMFESINKENIASMRSSSVLKQVIVKELNDGDVLIEDFHLDK